MFSPGELSARDLSGMALGGFTSHAEFESQCSRCHAPLETTQDVLCTACHTDVSHQIASGSGTHGKLEAANQCAGCHPDHRGRDFDPALLAQDTFNHDMTSFSLAWHQVDFEAVPMSCEACHQESNLSVPVIEKCSACHTAHDAQFMNTHLQEMGGDCLACHDGQDRIIEFDHATTSFPLEGKHTRLGCASCHEIGQGSAALFDHVPALAQVFQGLPLDCAQCHSEASVHGDLFSSNCEDCHTAQSWALAKWQGQPFDHALNTRFSLARHAQDYDGRNMTCKYCHQGDVRQFDQGICVDCHGKEDQGFMQRHQEQFGPACLDCHDGTDRMSNFDHANFFELEGIHTGLDCQACHADKVFLGTPTACSGCHAEPAIHAGTFGLQCQYCHTSQAWSPAPLRLHNFPLDHGGSGEQACETCHQGSYGQYSCYGCHEHQLDAINQSHLQSGISSHELPDCAQCHPAGSIVNEPSS